MGKFGVLSGKPLFREVTSDFTPSRDTVEVEIDPDIVHTGVDSDAYVVREFGGGEVVGVNRFITWRGYQRGNDFLELYDHSLDALVSGPPGLRLKFIRSPLLDGISVSEDKASNSVLLLVPTLSAVHVFSFVNPGPVPFDDEGDYTSPGLFETVDPKKFGPQRLAPVHGPQGDQPYAACSTFNRATREAMFAIAYRGGQIHVISLSMEGQENYTILGESSSLFSKLSGLWRIGGSGLSHEDPGYSARAVCFLPPTKGSDSPVLAAACRDRMVRFHNVNRRTVISTVPIFVEDGDRAIPQLEDQKVMIAVTCDARGVLDKVIVSMSMHQAPPGSTPSIHTLAILERWSHDLKPVFSRTVALPPSTHSKSSSTFVFRDFDFNNPVKVQKKEPIRNPVVLLDMKPNGDQLFCLTQNDGVMILDLISEEREEMEDEESGEEEVVEDTWLPVKRSEPPPLNPKELDEGAGLGCQDAGGFVSGEDLLESPMDLRGRVRRLMLQPGLFSVKHMEQACKAMRMERIENPPSSERIEDWVDYASRVLETKAVERSGFVSPLEVFDAALQESKRKRRTNPSYLRFNYSETDVKDIGVDAFDIREEELEVQVEQARAAADSIWLDFYRMLVELWHGDSKPLGLIVSCETGLKAVVKSHPANVGYLRGMTVAEEIYVIACDARDFTKRTILKPELEKHIEETIEKWIPSGERVQEAMIHFYGRMFAAVIASRGAVFEELVLYKKSGYEGFRLGLSNGNNEREEEDEEEMEEPQEIFRGREIPDLEFAIKTLFEWDRIETLSGLDKSSALKEFLKIAEIDPSSQVTLDERRPFAAASAGLMQAQRSGDIFSSGAAWMAGPEGAGVLLASLRQCLQARAALSAVTPIVDLLVHVRMLDSVRVNVERAGATEDVKLFAIEKDEVVASPKANPEVDVLMDEDQAAASSENRQVTAKPQLLYPKVDMNAAIYRRLVQLTVAVNFRRNFPREHDKSKRRCVDMALVNNTTIGKQDGDSSTIAERGNVSRGISSTWMPPALKPINTALEEVVGARAREAWLASGAPSPIPLPPFANFAWEWGVGAYAVQAVKYLWPGKDDTVLLQYVLNKSRCPEFLSLARIAIACKGRNVAAWRWVAFSASQTESIPAEELVEEVFAIARDAWKIDPSLLLALAWPTLKSIKEGLLADKNVLVGKQAPLSDTSISKENKKERDLMNARIKAAHRMAVLYRFFDDLGLILNRFDFVARCCDVGEVHARLAPKVPFAEFEAKYDSTLRTQAFRYELKLKDYKACFHVLNAQRKDALQCLEQQGLPPRKGLLNDDSWRWLRMVMNEIRASKRYEFFVDLPFQEWDSILFCAFCKNLEEYAVVADIRGNKLYPALIKVYMKRGAHRGVAKNQYTYGVRLETAGLVDQALSAFEGALEALEQAEEAHLTNDKYLPDFTLKGPDNRLRFYRRSDMFKRVALCKAQLQLIEHVKKTVGVEESKRVVVLDTAELDKMKTSYVDELAARMTEYRLFVNAMSLCRAWDRPWDGVCTSFVDRMVEFFHAPVRVSPPWLVKNLLSIEEYDIKQYLAEHTNLLSTPQVPTGLKKDPEGRTVGSPSAIKSLRRLKVAEAKNSPERMWFLLEYLALPNSKKPRKLGAEVKEEEDGDESMEEDVRKEVKEEEGEEEDVATLRRLEMVAKCLVEADLPLPQKILGIMKKKRILAILRIYYDAGCIEECSDLLLNYLLALTVGDSSEATHGATPQEFGLETSLSDPNSRGNNLLPLSIITRVKKHLEELSAEYEEAAEKLAELKMVLRALKGLQVKVKNRLRGEARLPPFGGPLAPFQRCVPAARAGLPPVVSSAFGAGLPPVGSSSFGAGMPPSKTGLPPVGSNTFGAGLPLGKRGFPPVVSNMPSFGSNSPSAAAGLPPFGTSIPSAGAGLPPFGSSIPSSGAGLPPFGVNSQSLSANLQPAGSSKPPFGSDLAPFGSNSPSFGAGLPPAGSNPPFGTGLPPGGSTPTFGAGLTTSGSSKPLFGAGLPPFGSSTSPAFGAGLISNGPASTSSGSSVPPFGSGLTPSGSNLPPFGSGSPAFGSPFGANLPQSGIFTFGKG